uniref:3-oxoacyl-[acyl-carrier protein] reductase n=1 Tax=Candidatus Kentrum sp. FM TaxID=2126340 RepID=A0A450S544_9GAMM|nr:MAG: 3-oxoacyl-[acyl-carrier protein] reductase [Candidatus Kentron sp. FM]VFJ47357.1 MAG: 3-oxoacyl-[acyl-carrier protein] reductase [Candidatus Kentron sp. FM]VFK07563.1 MAG: 3-oxoacyl-[acyl-carrier protein] reductase [Candidatus Kentron sp. FM]
MLNLNGQVALITGSSRGIGRAIAYAFASHGCRVVLNHTREGKDIVKTREELDAIGTDYRVFRGSVADAVFVNDMVETVVGEWGRIDILVNNAGINRDKPTMLLPERDWDEVIDTNLKGAFLCSKAVTKPMISQRSGRIINISSLTAVAGREGQSNYGAAKAGLIGMTKSMARELGAYNILVNALIVGLIDTLMTKKLPRAIQADLKKIIPLGRIGQPEEVANVCLFLASELSTYITGSTINCSGGGYM